MLQDKVARQSSVQLSAINSWYSNQLADRDDGREDSDNSSDGGDNEWGRDPDNSTNDAAEHQDLMDQIEGSDFSFSRLHDDKLTRLNCAAMAIISDEMAKVYGLLFAILPLSLIILSSQNLPEDDADEESVEEMFAQECRDILSSMPMPRQPPSLKLPDTITKPFGQGTLGIESLNLDALIKMRYQHQTRHAALAVRTQGSQSTITEETETTERQKEESIYWQIIKEMHAILKEQQGKGAGTGKERVIRWHHGDGDKNVAQDIPVIIGNAANSAKVARQTAKKVSGIFNFSPRPQNLIHCQTLACRLSFGGRLSSKTPNCLALQ
jgi:hypothetical protein